MDKIIDNNINLDNKIDEIKNLYNIINKIDNNNKKILLKYRFQTELDFMIDKLEDYYYKYILKNKSEKKIQNETEKMIYSSRKTMETFMPYILLYNINEQYNNQVNQ
jgi:hypothetical protein|tara:strand:+ start:593 stop:913 length:321 start_codon:yes stop_codon:yes gene_type:complete